MDCFGTYFTHVQLWCNSCSKCYAMDCFGTYFTHVQSCDATRVQSATQWTASVHTLHMSKTCFDTVPKKGVSNSLGRKNEQKHCKTWDEIAKMKKNVRPSVRAGPRSSTTISDHTIGNWGGRNVQRAPYLLYHLVPHYSPTWSPHPRPT